jgi:hypothetical protein
MHAMAQEARNHHFIPQSYLRGFANPRDTGSRKKWYTFVNDFQKKETTEKNVKYVCSELDFMRFEVEGHRPDKLETELGKFEGKAVEAIRRVVQNGNFAGEDRVQVLNLMALLAVRSPEQRENMREFQARVAERLMEMTLETKERWEGQMEQLSASGGRVNKSVTYEDAKAFHESKAYKIEVPRERHIGTELMLFETVLEQLARRKWTLYTVPGDYGEFITTNRPVVIAYIEPEKVPAYMRHSPGFALSGTEIFFPLTRRGLLVGRWDRGDETIEPDQPFVGVMNNQMIQHSHGQVFAPNRSVLYHDPLMRLHWDDKMIERFTTQPTPEEIEQFKAEHGVEDTP